MNRFLIPAIAIGGFLFGTDCHAEIVELVAPVQEKTSQISDTIIAYFRAIAPLVILAAIALLGIFATRNSPQKKEVMYIAATVLIASILISNIEVVNSFLGLS